MIPLHPDFEPWRGVIRKRWPRFEYQQKTMGRDLEDLAQEMALLYIEKGRFDLKYGRDVSFLLSRAAWSTSSVRNLPLLSAFCRTVDGVVFEFNQLIDHGMLTPLQWDASTGIRFEDILEALGYSETTKTWRAMVYRSQGMTLSEIGQALDTRERDVPTLIKRGLRQLQKRRLEPAKTRRARERAAWKRAKGV